MAKKLSKKINTRLDSLHPYVSNVNKKFIVAKAKKLGVPYSLLMDGMISHVRKNKIAFGLTGKNFIHRT